MSHKHYNIKKYELQCFIVLEDTLSINILSNNEVFDNFNMKYLSYFLDNSLFGAILLVKSKSHLRGLV